MPVISLKDVDADLYRALKQIALDEDKSLRDVILDSLQSVVDSKNKNAKKK